MVLIGRQGFTGESSAPWYPPWGSELQEGYFNISKIFKHLIRVLRFGSSEKGNKILTDQVFKIFMLCVKCCE